MKTDEAALQPSLRPGPQLPMVLPHAVVFANGDHAYIVRHRDAIGDFFCLRTLAELEQFYSELEGQPHRAELAAGGSRWAAADEAVADGIVAQRSDSHPRLVWAQSVGIERPLPGWRDGRGFAGCSSCEKHQRYRGYEPTAITGDWQTDPPLATARRLLTDPAHAPIALDDANTSTQAVFMLARGPRQHAHGITISCPVRRLASGRIALEAMARELAKQIHEARLA